MEFTVKGGTPGAVITLNQRWEQDVLYLDICMEQPEAAIPQEFSVGWTMPIRQITSVWSSLLGADRQFRPQWAPNVTESRLASGMPLHTLIGVDGTNRLTVALSDAATPAAITTGVVEETACLECFVRLFTLPTTPIRSYKTTLRLDERSVDWCNAVQAAADWWRQACGYTPAPVPEHARLPMNSLWYSFHQRLEADAIVEQCRLSKPLGMDTVIIDDGWQTLDSNRGYAYCGDWQPERLPDMRGLTEAIHAEGMKVMLWYSVPFVGIHSKKYREFRDMMLDGAYSNGGAFALDPRYKPVREYLTEIYAKAVADWDLDGLKLDFIDAFRLCGRSLEPDDRRDIASLEEAVDTLMQGVTDALRAIKPDILIEFRQSYVGPAICKYGNMLRVGDCPNDPLSNRRAVVDLRLTSGGTAVHSDMLMWHAEDAPECVAQQLTAALFAVPQISVLIDRLPAAQLATLRHYLAFWRQHRDVLLDGSFWAHHPEAIYSQVGARKGGTAIVAAYTDPVLEYTGETLIAFNGGVHGDFILKNAAGRCWRAVDCTGAVLACGTAEEALVAVSVPLGGMLTVE